MMMPTSPQTMPVAMPAQNTTPLRRCPRLYSSNSRRRRSDRRSWVNRSGRSDDASNTWSTVPMLAPLMTWHSDFAESVNSNGKIALSQVISSGSFWPMPTRPVPQRNSSYLFCGKKMTQSVIRTVEPIRTWAATDQYSSGKYTSDGVYDPNVVDRQLGCAARSYMKWAE